jgi:hypothetical protein
MLKKLVGALLFSQSAVEGVMITPINYKSHLPGEELFNAIIDPRSFSGIERDNVHDKVILSHYNSYCSTKKQYEDAVEKSTYKPKEIDPNIKSTGVLYAESSERLREDRDGVIKDGAYRSPSEKKSWNHFVSSKAPCIRPN